MEKFIVSQERGSRNPQVKNGASPKSHTSRNNLLTSEKGSDTKQFFVRKAVFAVMVITMATVVMFNFVSCRKSCICIDRNTDYVYPEIDLKDNGYKNCQEVQKEINNSGASVSCSRSSIFD
jgi:hypothetical protein